MVEKNEIQENQPEEIEVDIQPDQPEQEAAASVDNDEELANYTKNVSKRINKKNQQVRAAEERAAQLEQMVRQQQAQLSAMQQSQVQQQATVIQKEEEALQAKETQADDLYKRAVESGDAELMSKADTLKSDISIQKEKIRLAKNRQQAVPQEQPVDQQYYQEPVGQQQETVEPTQEALGWYEKNKWYGDQEDPGNLEATQFAFFQHNMLINEGYEADSDEYYGELNNRIYKVYPHLQSADEGDGQKDGGPPVQRVSSASVGSRQQTRGKVKNGVTFSKSEVERLRGLKPHNMSEQDWLKRVAQEKQKIAQREAV
jgi:hypothetical protein